MMGRGGSVTCWAKLTRWVDSGEGDTVLAGTSCIVLGYSGNEADAGEADRSVKLRERNEERHKAKLPPLVTVRVSAYVYAESWDYGPDRPAVGEGLLVDVPVSDLEFVRVADVAPGVVPGHDPDCPGAEGSCSCGGGAP